VNWKRLPPGLIWSLGGRYRLPEYPFSRYRSGVFVNPKHLLVAFLFASYPILADEAPLHLFARADFGVASMTGKLSSALPGEMDEIKKLNPYSFVVAVMNSESRMGLGVLYQGSSSKGSISSPMIVSDGSVMLQYNSLSIEQENSLIAGIFLVRVPISQSFYWTAEVGLGSATQNFKNIQALGNFTSSSYAGTFTESGKIGSSGLGVVANTGLDFYFTPNIGVGFQAQYLSATVKDNTGEITVNLKSGTETYSSTQSVSSSSSSNSNSDASQIGLSGGLRIHF